MICGDDSSFAGAGLRYPHLLDCRFALSIPDLPPIFANKRITSGVKWLP
jgi:hypothetical protein